MKPMVPRLIVSAAACALLACNSGCQTTDAADADSKEEAALVVQEEKVWRDPPVGSHMKRRRRVDARQDPSVTRPTMGGKITDETDTLVMPPTAGQMEMGRPSG